MTVDAIIDAIEDGMKESGKTWREVYISSGISRNTVVYWKRGKVGPNLSTLNRVLHTVGLKLSIEKI